MKTQFTPQELKEYFSKKKERMHFFRDKTIDYANDIRVHAEGLYPVKLIDERRPNETLEVKDYRKKSLWLKRSLTFQRSNLRYRR